MIDKLIFARSPGFDPFVNQAMEAELMRYAAGGAFVTYLWANDRTVVVGKNQNAFAECDTEALRSDGGFLARRLSGGGAVYHDKGNLNFTFIAPKQDFSLDRQFGFMLAALRRLGIKAERSGRNDMTVGGRKFSGNAFFYSGNAALHHGTILIGSNGAEIAKYLSVSKVKLAAKGVASVASRIINLGDVRAGLDAEQMAEAIFAEVKAEIDLPPRDITASQLQGPAFAAAQRFFTSSEWRYGDNVFYDVRVERRFAWGTADIRFKMKGTGIEKARIYADSLDTAAVAAKERDLAGIDIYAYNGPLDDIVGALKEVLCTT